VPARPRATPAPPPPATVTDPRVLQANERTLLAWLRTGVGLMAFGFLLARASAWLQTLAGAPAVPGDAKLVWIGLGFVALGTTSCGVAARQYLRMQHLLLRGEPVRAGHLAPLVAVLVLILGAVLLALLVVDAPRP
jgi:putative membrane protein